ncbi:hypothetical protein L0337_16295 [candidate division KSB1 bacterium]|nr:hypothetical protein [candidate division KSB1 bacterium]
MLDRWIVGTITTQHSIIPSIHQSKFILTAGESKAAPLQCADLFAGQCSVKLSYQRIISKARPDLRIVESRIGAPRAGGGSEWGMILNIFARQISLDAIIALQRQRFDLHLLFAFFKNNLHDIYSLRDKITVIARRLLPKQSLDFQRIASLKNARNDVTK